jgi:hypothetical protein
MASFFYFFFFFDFFIRDEQKNKATKPERREQGNSFGNT